MATKQRGEVEAVGRDGAVYTLKLGIGAICQLEEQLDRPVLSLFEDLQKGTIRVTTLRAFVKAAAGMDDDAANDMLENVGVTKMIEAVTTSLLATFGVNPEAANPPAPVRRTKAGAGNSKPAASTVSSVSRLAS